MNSQETALADKLEIGHAPLQKWIPKKKDEALMVLSFARKLILTSLRRFVVLKKNSFETGY